MTRQALYFGCWSPRRLGHYLHHPSGATVNYFEPRADLPTFPWSTAHLDGGLLRNGKHPDVEDGRVFWTCGGRDELWLAFFWWDRSGDSRGNSSSGFYVTGFELADRDEAFAYACATFPAIVARQAHPLVVQER